MFWLFVADAAVASPARPHDPQAPALPGVAAPPAVATAAAFATLVDRHYAPLLRYLTRQTGDPELAADLAQDTFLAAYRALDQLADDARFAAWLHGIARNRLRMEWRRRRLRRFLSLDWLTAGTDIAPPALQHPDAAPASDDRDTIQRALDALTPALREALLLHDLEGFTGEEVARILGISPAAARKRICRAEAAFRAAYGPPDQDRHHHDG